MCADSPGRKILVSGDKSFWDARDVSAEWLAGSPLLSQKNAARDVVYEELQAHIARAAAARVDQAIMCNGQPKDGLTPWVNQSRTLSVRHKLCSHVVYHSWLAPFVCSRCESDRQPDHAKVPGEAKGVVLYMGQNAGDNIHGLMWPHALGKLGTWVDLPQSPLPAGDVQAKLNSWYDQYAAALNDKMAKQFDASPKCGEPVIENGKLIGGVQGVIREYGAGWFRVSLQSGSLTKRCAVDVKLVAELINRGDPAHEMVVTGWVTR